MKAGKKRTNKQTKYIGKLSEYIKVSFLLFEFVLVLLLKTKTLNKKEED